MTHSAGPVPISVPPRSELWRRNQLALSVLAHRDPREAVAAARAVLAGDLSIPDAKEVTD